MFTSRKLALPLLAAVGAMLVLGAHAQEAATRQMEAGKLADMNNWMWNAQQGKKLSPGGEAVRDVLKGVEAKDCAAAVRSLNEGLAKGHSEVQVLAGAMFQEGICVKQSWDRATRLYERAHVAGSPVAAARLAAGYAGSVGGRDLGTAMYWAVKAKTPMPAECQTAAAVVDDTAKFVAALNAMPAGRLQACVYTAAVMATVQAEVNSPDLQGAFPLTGDVRVNFVPSSGQLDIAPNLQAVIPAGRMGNAEALEKEVTAARTALSEQLRIVADRAVKQNDRPAGVQSDWRVSVSYAFAPVVTR